MSDSSESREDERHPLLLRVDHRGGSGLHDFTENISAGGMFLRSDRALPVGARTCLLVGFPGLLEPVEIEVEVVWTRPASGDEPAGLAVRIPADRPEHRARIARIAGAAVAAPAAPGRTYRILVVEDNALLEAMYASALERLLRPGEAGGIEVEFARDGLQGLARLEREPRIDLVIADLFMPVMDGFTLLERVRAVPDLQQVPVIAISGGKGDARERALAAGVDVFLRKPVKVQDVLGTVRALLRL
jgi:uncharacterized protein (TIGR02266 family)